jgi:lipopolysaccharide transport system ATP-binding protein
MSDIVIKAENLGKMYTIGHQTENGRYAALRDVLMQNARTLWNKTKDLATGKPIIHGDTTEEVWALKDVSFEIHRGEAVGIIGRNGAGKSTLLKVLSRITEPSTGRVTIKGRVASLLEVGTGFHPELSGRENIYLNGTILGMTRVEIKQKFDEIVAFAEVEKYLDTPVKRYSSGMYVRLAFAVAAHLEPEILVVDEVLAVGDAQFQKKCLEKMDDVAQKGRTVMFVSHNMTAILKLCPHAIWIDEGRICNIGPSETLVQSYLASGLLSTSGQVIFDVDENKEACITSVSLRNGNDEVATDFEVLSPIQVNIAFCCLRRFTALRLDVMVSRYDGIPVFATTSQDYNMIDSRFEPGSYVAQMLIPKQLIAAGDYYLNVNICEPNVKNYDLRESILRFGIRGDPYQIGRNLGFLVYPFQWSLLTRRNAE